MPSWAEPDFRYLRGFTSIPKLVLAMRNCSSSAWADRALSGRQRACLGSTWGTRLVELSTAVTVMYCFGCGIDRPPGIQEQESS